MEAYANCVEGGQSFHIRFGRRVAVCIFQLFLTSRVDIRFQVYCSVEIDSVKPNVVVFNGVLNISVLHITSLHVAVLWVRLHIGSSYAARMHG